MRAVFLGGKDESYRRQAWNFMLAGGSAFDGLDYSFSAGHEDGGDLEPNGPGGGSPSVPASAPGTNRVFGKAARWWRCRRIYTA